MVSAKIYDSKRPLSSFVSSFRLICRADLRQCKAKICDDSEELATNFQASSIFGIGLEFLASFSLE